ncbi:hypothetical protein SRM1_00669 [Pseudomonas fluorescens]|nr:hypothetical protein SRM1_00669 [Pseudomonas fluorescens]
MLQQVSQLAGVTRFQFSGLPFFLLFSQPLLGVVVDGPAGDPFLFRDIVIAFEQLQVMAYLINLIGHQLLLDVLGQPRTCGTGTGKSDGASRADSNAVRVVATNGINEFVRTKKRV